VGKTKLVLRNNFSSALTRRKGRSQRARTNSGDFGLAAVSRAIASEEQLLLPGDKITWTVGAGSSEMRVIQSKHGGFYALATTVDVPARKNNGAVAAFTTMIKQLDDVLAGGLSGPAHGPGRVRRQGVPRQVRQSESAQVKADDVRVRVVALEHRKRGVLAGFLVELVAQRLQLGLRHVHCPELPALQLLRVDAQHMFDASVFGRLLAAAFDLAGRRIGRFR
jgi:hypothetical protein